MSSACRPLDAANRRITHWVLAATLLLLALLPSWTPVLAAARGDAPGWTAVCTARGIEWRALGDEPALPGWVHALSDHCPLCTLGGGDSALPPSSQRPWPSPPAGPQAWPSAVTPPGAGHAWTPALPRAPPGQG